MALYPYRAGNQFRTYISQFMRVFSGFQYDSGDGVLKRIPVRYGTMSRIVAGILSKRDPFLNNNVPMIAINMSSITSDPSNKRPNKHVDAVPNFTKPKAERTASERIIGPSFIMSMELSVYASSTKELFDIIEQILLIFNPRVHIKVDDNVSNVGYITDITLEGINNEIQYPMGTEKGIIMMTLNFDVPVRLKYPHDPMSDVINTITTNIISDEGSTTFEDEIV